MILHKRKIVNIAKKMSEYFPKDNKSIFTFFKRMLDFSVDNKLELEEIYNKRTIEYLKKDIDQTIYNKYKSRIKKSFDKVLNVISRNIGIDADDLDKAYLKKLYQSNMIIDGIALTFALKREMIKKKKLKINNNKNDIDIKLILEDSIDKSIKEISEINFNYIQESSFLDYIVIFIILAIIIKFFKGVNYKNPTYQSQLGNKIEKASDSFVEKIYKIKDKKEHKRKIRELLFVVGEIVLVVIYYKYRLDIIHHFLHFYDKLKSGEYADDDYLKITIAVGYLILLFSVTFYLTVKLIISLYKLLNGTVFYTIIGLGSLILIFRKMNFVEKWLGEPI